MGPYRILEAVGEGGFGIVYKAEQTEPVQRTVALKVLRGGPRDDAARQRVRLRFEAERQSLAKMQHAAIAQVYDAGQTNDGHMYLAMEYIDGPPITTWCDSQQLNLDGRLKLFLKVCSAIQHAHQRGVVHRDIKPNNILLHQQSDATMPKVIDFGVAKVIEEEQNEAGVATREGAFVGTPGYMSPEQTLGAAIDTRTDVYALGVLLYELMTGEIPFQRERLTTGNVAAIAKVVCEEEPRRLGAVLDHVGGRLPRIASQRNCKIQVLRKRLRGDLAWVAHKAIAKDPDARYASVSALIQDIHCLRRSEPVSARQPVALYVMRRFAGRHRLGVAIGLTLAVLTAAGVAAMAWFLSNMAEARRVADAQRQIADAERAESARSEYYAHIAAAQGSLQLGRISSASGHLGACPEERRGWEWRFLASQLDTSTARFRGPGVVGQVQWLDADRLLVCYGDHDSEIRSISSGEVVRRIPMRGNHRRSSYDSASGRFFTASTGRVVEAWQDPEWEDPTTLFESPHALTTMQLHPDGDALLVCDRAGGVYWIDAHGHSEPRLCFRAPDHIVDLQFFADGERIAVAHFLGAVEIRDTATGAVIRSLVDRANYTALAVAGDRVYGFGTRKIQAWEASTGATVARTATRQEIAKLCVSADQTVLYGSGGFGAAEVSAWDAATLENVGRYYGHRRGVLALDLHPDGTRIATGSTDHTVRVWTAIAKPRVRRLQAGFDVRHLSVSADGKAMACVGRRGRVTVWDASTLDQTLALQTDLELRGSALGRDRLYASGNELHAIDRATGSITVGEPTQGLISALALDDDESWLAGAVASAGMVTLWKLPEMERRHELECPALPHIMFDSHSQTFLVPCADGVVREISTSGTVRHRIAGPTPVYNLTVDGERMGISSEQAHVLSPDLSLAPWSAHGFGTFDIAFSPDGTRIATGGGDYITRLWSADGHELLVLEASQKPIIHVAFAAGGATLVGLSHTWENPTELLVWQAPPSAGVVR